jgi:uncharacterized Zn finger protein
MRFDERFPPVSKPRKAKGGIKARAQRGGFGTKWWAKRWIAVLERLDMGARLQRGRSYARAGQVLDIQIAPGAVTARVQGSRAQPYRVTIRVATLGKPTWRKITEHISNEARFTAKLLGGEMPQDIEEAFGAVGVSLFPATLSELHTECSCPDWANPCKHVAATYYLIGEEFDRDPFLLFALRGAAKEQILTDLRGLEPEPRPSDATRPNNPTSLPNDFDSFWNGAQLEAPRSHTLSSATKSPKRILAAFPFWRGPEMLDSTLAGIDEAAAADALALLAEMDR